jgi:hypothetical protein
MTDVDDFLAEIHPRLVAELQASTTETRNRDWRCGPPRTR